MKLFHGYAARLGYALSLGKAAVDAAVYLPVRDVWVGGEEAKAAAEANDALAKILLEGQCDFDFIDDDALERDSTKPLRGRMRVGKMRYGTVLVSRCRRMGDKAKEKLEALAAGGVKVLWVGWEGEAGYGERIEGGEAAARVKPVIHIEPSLPQVRACKRVLDNGAVYFLTNEGEGPLEGAVRFAETGPMLILDPEICLARTSPYFARSTFRARTPWCMNSSGKPSSPAWAWGTISITIRPKAGAWGCVTGGDRPKATAFKRQS